MNQALREDDRVRIVDSLRFSLGCRIVGFKDLAAELLSLGRLGHRPEPRGHPRRNSLGAYGHEIAQPRQEERLESFQAR